MILLVEVPCVKRNAIERASFAFIADMAWQVSNLKSLWMKLCSAWRSRSKRLLLSWNSWTDSLPKLSRLKKNFRRINIKLGENSITAIFQSRWSLVDSSIRVHNAPLLILLRSSGCLTWCQIYSTWFLWDRPLESSFADLPSQRPEFLRLIRYTVLTGQRHPWLNSSLRL